MDPAVSGSAPPIRLTSVDFPAPLGPITPRISPRRTEKLSPLTAAKPPKRLVTSINCNRAEVPPLAPGGGWLDAVGCDKASNTSKSFHETANPCQTGSGARTKRLDETNHSLWQDDSDKNNGETEQRIVQIQATGLKLEGGSLEENAANDRAENRPRAPQKGQQNHLN